jgi:protein SCO1/2
MLPFLRRSHPLRFLLTRGSAAGPPPLRFFSAAPPAPPAAPPPSSGPTPTAAAPPPEGAPAAGAPAGGASAKGPVSWASFFLTAATLLGLVVYYRSARARQVAESQARVESVGTPLLGGPWSLVDSSGRPFTSGDLLGRYVLLYFGFTYCPDICPSELQKMAAVVRALERKPELRGAVAPVFISVDPARDTCEQVGAYCKDFHPDMIGLTGTPGQVAQAAKAYRVYFSEVDRKEGDDEVDYLGAQLACGPCAAPPPPVHPRNV